MVSWLKILCAVDFSRSSSVAVEHAAELARRFGAELTLIHVRDAPHVSGARIAAAAKALENEAHELGWKLGAWKAEAERLAGRPVRTLLASGAPADEIVRTSVRESFDLIVAGTSRKAVARLLHGSVADQIARHATCAVLVVREPVERGDGKEKPRLPDEGGGAQMVTRTGFEPMFSA